MVLLKETKVPEDNRVALSPQEIVDLQQKFPDVEFVVQKSDIRVYSDEEYALKGLGWLIMWMIVMFFSG